MPTARLRQHFLSEITQPCTCTVRIRLSVARLSTLEQISGSISNQPFTRLYMQRLNLMSAIQAQAS